MIQASKVGTKYDKTFVNCRRIFVFFFVGRCDDQVQQAPRGPEAGQDPRPHPEEAEAPHGREHVLLHGRRARTVTRDPLQRLIGQEARGAGADGDDVQGSGPPHKGRFEGVL